MHHTGFRLARIMALFLMLGCILIFSAGVFYFQEFAASNLEEFTVYTYTLAGMEQILSRTGLSYNWWIQYNLLASIFTAAAFCMVGGFIFLRRAGGGFGLLVAVTLVLFGTVPGYPVVALRWAYPALARVLEPLSVYAWPLFFLMFYLFPDGRFVPRWTRWAAITMMALFTAIIFGYGSKTPPAPYILATLLLIVIGVGSQVYRYRNVADGIQRQQTKWVLLAIIVTVCFLVILTLPLAWSGALEPDSPLAPLLLWLIAAANLITGLLPLSIGLAILRYRLFDIDVIIRRTLVYSVLTILLGLVFFGGITLLQWLFTSISNQQSTISIVLSTLAIAALFNPLRKQIQEFVDRRFYRRKYNAEQALASFSALAREEVDLEEISGRLLEVVEETVQPESVSLWLKPTTDGSKKR